MPIPELVDYVRTQTQGGVAAEDLRVALMEVGWHELDIENALHDVAAGLHPTTPGASIHEDLAQVRGMVAHLAKRLKGVEAQLASLPSARALPVQAQLPSTFIGADHELPIRRSRFLRRGISLLASVVLFVCVGVYTRGLVASQTLLPIEYLLGVVVVGCVLMVASIMCMRSGRGWAASLTAAGGLTLWMTSTYLAWYVYHSISWIVAAALAVLFIVLAFVLNRWISRLSK